jgi:hypothetical protein
MCCQIVGRTLDAFIDDTETNCVSKAQRYHVFKMLRSEQKYRENIDQVNQPTRFTSNLNGSFRTVASERS